MQQGWFKVLLPNSLGCFNPSITAIAHVLNLPATFNTPALINLMGANKEPMAGMAQIKPKYPSTSNPRLKANPAFLNMQQKTKNKRQAQVRQLFICVCYSPMTHCPRHPILAGHTHRQPPQLTADRQRCQKDQSPPIYPTQWKSHPRPNLSLLRRWQHDPPRRFLPLECIENSVEQCFECILIVCTHTEFSVIGSIVRHLLLIVC